MRTAEELRERGILLRSLPENIHYSTAVVRMVGEMFASLAEYSTSVN